MPAIASCSEDAGAPGFAALFVGTTLEKGREAS